MSVDIDKVREALTSLKAKGFTDEQIAVGIGQQMPGGAHPSSMTVYRWRNGRNTPREMYCWAILEMAKNQKEQ
jgi:transcriptional regulator with XRE-family HTH domain